MGMRVVIPGSLLVVCELQVEHILLLQQLFMFLGINDPPEPLPDIIDRPPLNYRQQETL